MRKRLYERISRVSQYIGNMKLQTKLVASYILIILIPIIVFSIYMFNDSYQSTIKDTIKSNQYMIEMEYSSMMNNIELMERTAQLMLSDDKVMEYVLVKQEMATEALMEFSRTVMPNLIRLQFNNPNIAHIRLYTDNDQVKEIWPIFLHESRIADKPWYDEVMQQNGVEIWEFDAEDKDVMRRASTDIDQNKAKISLLREIRSSPSGHVGIAQIDMYLEHFFPKAFSNVQDGQSQVLLLDRHSRFYYNKQHPFLADIPLDELRQSFQNHLADSGQSYFEIAFDGVPYICIYKKLDLLDTYLINVVSLQEPLNKIHATRNMLIVVSVMLIAILSLITYLTSRILFKRLRNLQNSMKRVRSGDFQVKIDVHGGGEVGEIAYHFKMLMKKNQQPDRRCRQQAGCGQGSRA